jgi:hypothetical protein
MALTYFLATQQLPLLYRYKTLEQKSNRASKAKLAGAAPTILLGRVSACYPVANSLFNLSQMR